MSQKNTNENNRNMCRLCLKQLINVGYSLLESSNASMLETLTGIKLFQIGDCENRSTAACPKCIVNLKLAFNIQQNMLRANEKLVQMEQPPQPPSPLLQTNDDLIVNDDNDGFHVKIETTQLTNEEIDFQVSNATTTTTKSEPITEFLPSVASLQTSQEEGNEGPEDADEQFSSGRDGDGDDSQVITMILTEEEDEEEEDNDDDGDDKEENENEPSNGDNDTTVTTDVVKSTTKSRCIICRKPFTQSQLTAHVQAHFTQRISCNYCTVICENLRRYQEHARLQHAIQMSAATKYHCSYCGITFKYGPLYKIHLDAHMSKDRTVGGGCQRKTVQRNHEDVPDTGPYHCTICYKSFKERRKFLAHTHERSKCPICDAQITKSNLLKHISNHTSGPQICELCGATLRSVESLRGHIAHTHSTDTFTCDQCGQVFKKRYTYNIHMKKHAGVKSHVCDTCGKGFLTLFSLTKHIKMAHLKLRPYICQYCKRGFSSRFSMRTHVRQHTNETPYKCEVCGEGFRQNVSLRSHRKSKHGIVEELTCACPVCGKQFSNSHAIDSHMRLH